MQIQKSYWGIKGWEATTSSDKYAACFRVTSTSGVVHHIIFANDIANGCMGGGFNAYATSASNSVDYITYIGDIAYNAAQGTGACYSGFNVYEPIASDTNTGTHIFEAGNFAWANKDGSPCSGSSTTDGEGINNDTWDMSQSSGTPYTQQGYVWNNISFLNGGYGIEQENNKAGGSASPMSTLKGTPSMETGETPTRPTALETATFTSMLPMESRLLITLSIRDKPPTAEASRSMRWRWRQATHRLRSRATSRPGSAEITPIPMALAASPSEPTYWEPTPTSRTR